MFCYSSRPLCRPCFAEAASTFFHGHVFLPRSLRKFKCCRLPVNRYLYVIGYYCSYDTLEYTSVLKVHLLRTPRSWINHIPLFYSTYLTVAAYVHTYIYYICTWFPYSYVVRGYLSTGLTKAVIYISNKIFRINSQSKYEEDFGLALKQERTAGHFTQAQ